MNLKRVPGHLVLMALSFICVFPLYWMLVTSLRTPNDIFSTSLLPTQPTLENYRFVWENLPFLRMVSNTLLMAALQTAGQLLTSLLAAYAFARWTFPGGQLLFALFALTWLVPFQVTMIPNYVLVAQLGWLNSLAGLVVPQLAAAFAVLLLFQSLKAFPKDLLDAARIDGASSWGTLWRVVTPNLRATLAALAILLFIGSWNEYFWPLLITNRMEDSVVQIGLQMFLTEQGDLWGPLMAAATMASLPVFVIYVLLQRQVINAFVKSGIR